MIHHNIMLLLVISGGVGCCKSLFASVYHVKYVVLKGCVRETHLVLRESGDFSNEP